MQNNRNRHSDYNHQHQQHNRNSQSRENYDYGNYTSDYRQSNNRNNYGSYEGAPSGYQSHYPGNPNPYDGMHGHNDYGYEGGNLDFTPAAGEYRGNGQTESNNNYDVGTGRTDGFYGPHNDRQTDMGSDFSGDNRHRRDDSPNRNTRPKGQTMDSWDNDNSHWRSHEYMRGDFGTEQFHRANRNGQQYYTPQNQGYFGENMGRHSGGNLYSDRFRNNENQARRSHEDGRQWHADSLSDRNIEGWGR